MSNKVYVVLETVKSNGQFRPCDFPTAVLSVHTKKENAVNAILKEHDDTIDEIIGGDDNNLSRISVDEEWDGTTCSVMDDGGNEWEWCIMEKELLP